MAFRRRVVPSISMLRTPVPVCSKSPVMLNAPAEVPGLMVPELVKLAVETSIVPAPWMVPVVALAMLPPSTVRVWPLATSIVPVLVRVLPVLTMVREWLTSIVPWLRISASMVRSPGQTPALTVIVQPFFLEPTVASSDRCGP